MPKDVYSELNAALLESQWWLQPNDYDTIKRNSSPLTETVMRAVRKGFSASGLLDVDVYAKVSRDSFVRPDSKSVLLYAEQGIIRGRNAVVLVFQSFDPHDIAHLDPTKMTVELAEVIRHELVHTEQLKRQAQGRSVSLTQVDRFRSKDPGQIQQGSGEEYFSTYTELDAWAHQFAEELLRRHGKRMALGFLTKTQDSKRLPMWISSYPPLANLSKPVLRAKFKKRVFDYINQLANKEIQ